MGMYIAKIIKKTPLPYYLRYNYTHEHLHLGAQFLHIKLYTLFMN